MAWVWCSEIPPFYALSRGFTLSPSFPALPTEGEAILVALLMRPSCARRLQRPALANRALGDWQQGL